MENDVVNAGTGWYRHAAANNVAELAGRREDRQQHCGWRDFAILRVQRPAITPLASTLSLTVPDPTTPWPAPCCTRHARMRDSGHHLGTTGTGTATMLISPDRPSTQAQILTGMIANSRVIYLLLVTSPR